MSEHQTILLINSGVYESPSPYGGTETHVYYLANHLAKNGVKVHLVSDYSTSHFHKNVILHPTNFNGVLLDKIGWVGYLMRHLIGGWKSYRVAKKLYKSEIVFDTIHCHGRFSSYFMTKFVKDQVIVTIHDSPPSKKITSSFWGKVFYGGWDKFFSNKIPLNAKHNIVVALDIKEKLLELGIPERKISYLPSGVDTELFHPSEHKMDVTSILYVGTLVKRKGVEYLIKSFVELAAGITLDIMGDGPDRRRLENLTKTLKLENRIKFLGPQRQETVAKTLRERKIYVLPSLSEGFPITLLEALSSGCAVITTSVSGIPHIIKQKENGILIDPENPHQIKASIELLIEDTSLRKHISKNGLELVQNKFSWNTVAEEVLTIYEDAY